MISNGKGDAINLAEVNMGEAKIGLAALASPGSETMACMTLRVHGNPGGPKSAFHVERGSDRPKQERVTALSITVDSKGKPK